jgi:hypothetical protein
VSGSDRHIYNLPTAPELAAFIPDTGASRRDIVVRCRGGGLRHISEWNPAYDPLAFPLLFPSGELGWEAGIPYCVKRRVTRTGEVVDHDPMGQAKDGQLSMKCFAAFYMFERSGSTNHLMRARSLYEEWIVIHSRHPIELCNCSTGCCVSNIANLRAFDWNTSVTIRGFFEPSCTVGWLMLLIKQIRTQNQLVAELYSLPPLVVDRGR